MTRGFEETLHEGVYMGYDVEEVLFDSKTEHQRLVIFRNPTFGRMMMLDGIVQVTEGDEYIYHEMLTHLPILAHGEVRKVLIIGGGDGGMLRETLRHASVEKVTMVEIDPAVVDLCRTHLPDISRGAFDDPRTDLRFADGAAFVADPPDRYDVMIVDSTDPVGPGEVLFQREFYENCRKCLTERGILATQNGVPFLQGKELADTAGFLKPLFADVSCYLASVPTYFGGPMAFGWATDDPKARRTPVETVAERCAAAGVETRYYNPETHVAAFALPNYVKELIE